MKRIAKFKFQAITSTISCTLVLILIGLTMLSILAARNIRNYVCENFIVTLTLGGSNDAVLGESDNTGAQTASMLLNLQHEPYSKEVRLINADEVLQQQLSVIGGNPEDFLGFNPYYSEIEIGMEAAYVNKDSMTRITKELTTKYPLVSEVSYEKDLLQNLNKNMHRLTLVLLVLTALLLTILVALINNMVRLSVYARRFHIHTMKLVGATYWFIRRPFLMRSFWIALISGLLTNVVLLGITEWFFLQDETYNSFLCVSDMLLTACTVLAAGLLLLLACTFFSVNHFLKMKDYKLHV